MSVNVVPSETIRFCDLCHKPISTESAYARHVAYCRRNRNRPRKRQKSCKECHSAKAKCSFEPECSRCRLKGLRCVYEAPVASSAHALETVQHPQNAPNIAASVSHGVPDTIHSSASTSLPASFGSSYSLGLSWPRSVADVTADPVAQHSVKLILESVRGLPLSLTSRETFSWFSHGYWYQPELPRNMAKCLELVNLYVDRKPSADDSLWAVVDQETRRLLNEFPPYPSDDLVSGIQAQIIYIIMAALDRYSASGIPEIRLNTLMSLELYFKKSFQTHECVWVLVDELNVPDMTWEKWLWNESRRRCSITWFLLSRFMDLKFGVICPSITDCRSLPLPSPASLWNARSRSEWESSRNYHRQNSQGSLKTFGDLLDARSSPPGSDLSKQLDRWHASCDKLGQLLTLATVLV
ncbi:hypothetical protein GGR52DRAFT_577011 [Hypoxylon sp. FL1284]|nr:hypothetical protein GGR52DRAFT_577011 [Hypoxylon sp. FL1284]